MIFVVLLNSILFSLEVDGEREKDSPLWCSGANLGSMKERERELVKDNCHCK